jgi:hypothetical protein
MSPYPRGELQSPRWERVAAASGLAAIPLLVAGGILAGSAGGPVGTSADGVAELLVRNEGQLFLGAEFVGLGAAALLWFAGSLRSTLHRAEGGEGQVSGVAFGAAVIAVLTLMLAAVFSIVAFRLVETVDDSAAARAFLAVSGESFHGNALPLALFVGANSLVAVRTRALPLWLAWPGLVVGVVVVSGWVVYPVWFFGLHLSLLWVLIASISLVRRGAAQPWGGVPHQGSHRDLRRGQLP